VTQFIKQAARTAQGSQLESRIRPLKVCEVADGRQIRRGHCRRREAWRARRGCWARHPAPAAGERTGEGESSSESQEEEGCAMGNGRRESQEEEGRARRGWRVGVGRGGAGRENDVGAGVRITWANMRCLMLIQRCKEG
jgi:hypothetical protein